MRTNNLRQLEKKILHILLQVITFVLRIGRRLERRILSLQKGLSSFDWSKAIFIYQPGKVASSTITEALSAEYNAPVVQIHSFDRDGGEHELNADLKKLQKNGSLPKLKIISLIRDPFSRNLSAFFQNLNKYQNNSVSFDGNYLDVQGLWDVYMCSPGSNWILEWWDLELKRNFGIDVFSVTFPDSGHVVIENDKASLLLMRYDLADNLKSNLISTFVGIAEFDLSKYTANVSKKKSYFSQYEQMKTRPITVEYFDRMYNSRYCQHFFSKELSGLKERWITS